MVLLEAVHTATSALGVVAEPAGLDDAALLDLQTALAAHRRAFDALAASVAGEIDRRSRRELGYNGLAQSKGFRTAGDLIQSVTGSTRAEAAKLVQLGSLATPDQTQPQWHEPISIALAHGGLSADAADSIVRGLGQPSAAITPPQLREAAEQLIAAAQQLDADQLYRRARGLRDELDQAGVATREQQQHDLRYFRAGRRPDGMVSGSFLLAPEDGALVVSVLDTALSPRRGGPRFVDAAAQAEADALLADPRTNDQLAADAVMALIRLAVDVDPGTTASHRRPAVRVHVTEDSIRRRGSGSIEGVPGAIGFGTVERHICDTGVLGIRFDTSGRVIDLGRDQRLFSAIQRVGLAARDGGCVFPGCGRPPSECEAHHIDQWHRDRGKTDLADGVLLCRFHHMLVHNNGWRIERNVARYYLVPPRAIDPQQSKRELGRRHPAEFFATGAGGSAS
ncbi:HNH endonuclease signature motif containing protein [soil metagenome]